MATVPIRQLRNQGSHVIDRVLAGESLTVTRDGEPVAELRPLGRARLSATALIERRRHLPVVDPTRLRADVDELVDPAL